MYNLIYEDSPMPSRHLPYWTRFRAYWPRALAWSMQITPIVLIIFFAGFYLAFTIFHHETISFSIMGVTVLLMFTAFLALYPTKYQIFNDRIRIVLGWVLHFDIPFSNIENVTAATFEDLWGLNLNFVISYSSANILQIIRKRGAKIHITPWDRKLFLEKLYKSLDEWRRNNPSS